jgi:hypothetical protein
MLLMCFVVNLISCGVSKNDLQTQVKASMQSKLDQDSTYKDYHLTVNSVTLIDSRNGTYDGIAKVLYMGQEHDVPIIVKTDKDSFMLITQPLAFLFLLAPQSDKDMAESSPNQIKLVAMERADAAIKKLVAMNATDPVPAEFSFLIDKASARYRTAKRNLPSSWTVQDVLKAYSSRADITDDAEAWYRDQK